MPDLKNPLPLLLAAFSGVIAVFGFAPFYFYPLPILALAILFLLVSRSATPTQAGWLGFAFGIGLFNAGIYWIYISLHEFGGMPPAMAAGATFALCAFLALFPAAAMRLSQTRALKPHWLVAMPMLWMLTEWIRGWIFTGFPWLAVGYSQVPDSPLSAYAPVIGVYGVSLITALLAALLAAVYRQSRQRYRNGALALTLLAGGGLLQTVQWSDPIGEPSTVALLQGNIAQDLKWDAQTLKSTLDHYFDLAMNSDAQLIIMPETALPLLWQQIPPNYLDTLTAHAKKHGSDILIGTVEYEQDRYYNSLVSIGSAPSQTYRKSHLVPFGEFIPLKSLLGWVYRDWLNIPLTDLSRGSLLQKPMQVGEQRVAVNICYEDVFGEEIVRQLPEATVLVNVSNDAWYGESYAADQHLQISQMRAMETARMMLRSTNTGATAIIDHDGQVLAHAPHFSTEVLTGKIQGYSGATPYVRFGNLPIVTLALLVLGLLWTRKKQ